MKWYRDSLIGKIMVPVLLVMLVGFGLIAILNGIWLYDVGWEGISEEAREAALRASTEMDGYFQKYAGILETLAGSEDVRAFVADIAYRSPSAHRGDGNYQEYLSTITRAAEQDSSIYNIFFGSEKTQTIFDISEWEAEADYRVSERDWYREGRQADSLYFTDPYRDGITGKPILSIVYPIYIDSSFKGMLGLDVSLEAVNAIAAKVSTVEGGYAFVMDRRGTILVHPDSQLVFSAKGTELGGDLGTICKDMIAGKVGYGETTDRKERLFVFYNPVKSTGWSLGVVVPKKTLTAPIVKRVMSSVLISLAAVIGVGLVASWAVRRSIAPLVHIADLAKRMAAGDLTMSVEARGTDEVGNLAASFSHMTAGLRAIVGSLKEYAEQVAGASQELSASSEEAGASIEEVAASTNEFASMAAQISGVVQRMDNSAERVASTASAGQEVARQAMDETERLQERMTELAGRVESLGTRSEEIGRIIGMISDIADQTNLLALNAAIEAARAGEYGRGFAVVAEEVRKLAEESAAATAEIGVLVEGIQKETGGTVSGMRESVVQVDETLAVVNTSAERLQEIQREVNSMMEDLAQVSTGTEQTASGSQEIAAATEEQSATIEEVAAMAQNLSIVAQRLQEVVDEFQIG